MQPREFSRGARRLLDRLLWYGRRYGHIHPSQEKLGTKLGRSGRNVSDRTVRTYLRELGNHVEVQQGGDGVEASYYFTAALLADLPSELTSGLLPGCFRAGNSVAPQEPAQHQHVAGENFRAEKPQLSSSGSSCSCDQSESTVQENPEPAVGAATEPSLFEKAQTDTITEAVRACGFEPTPNLIAKLARKRRHYGVTGFVVASAIARAYKLVEGTSNAPQRLPWFTTVVENALKQHSTTGAAVMTIRAAEPERTHHHASQTPILDHVAHVDQLTVTMAVVNIVPTSPAVEVCGRCGSDGVVNGTTPAVWCDCERGCQKRRVQPDYVDRLNRSGWRSSTTTAAVQPRPPQSQHGASAELKAAVATMRV